MISQWKRLMVKRNKIVGMERRDISFSPPDITDAECDEVVRALKSGWITTGPRTKELERRLAEYVSTNRAVCLSSATASEELNLRMLGIGEGDEVIIPAYTYTATASAAVHVGAKLRFVDSEADNPAMDIDAVSDLINENTKAVVMVDLAGIPCDYDKLKNILEDKKSLFRPSDNPDAPDIAKDISRSIGRVAAVSDAAHALGAYVKCKADSEKSVPDINDNESASAYGNDDRIMVGALADFTSYSFHAVKNFTTAEGGASVWKSLPGIDDDEMYKMYQLFSLHGQSKDAFAKTQLGAWEYDIVGPYYKCNMTDVAAAIGLRQLDRYTALLRRRREIIERYDEMCDLIGLGHLNHYTDSYESSGHLYLTFLPEADDAKRREIITRMAERGIACNVHYKPLPMMTAYKKMGFSINDYPNAKRLYESEITLPLHTKLSDEDIDYIIYNFTDIVRTI